MVLDSPLELLSNTPISLMMMGISVLVSTRYMYWRLTESVGFSSRDFIDTFFAIGLILALWPA